MKKGGGGGREDVGGSGGVFVAEVPRELREGIQQRGPQDQCLEWFESLALSLSLIHFFSFLKFYCEASCVLRSSSLLRNGSDLGI